MTLTKMRAIVGRARRSCIFRVKGSSSARLLTAIQVIARPFFSNNQVRVLTLFDKYMQRCMTILLDLERGQAIDIVDLTYDTDRISYSRGARAADVTVCYPGC
jgi:hypothetical protein